MITKGHIDIIEQLGYNFTELDEYEIKQIVDEIYIIAADSDEEFAEEYFEELYNLDDIPTVLRYAIDWKRVYRELEFDMTISVYDGEYYYIYN